MRTPFSLSRRDSFRLAGLGLVSSGLKAGVPFQGLRVGLASYSTRQLSVDDTIAVCRRAGIRHITLKSRHLPLASTVDERKRMRDKFREAGVEITGCGVIYLKSEAEARQALEYTRDLGATTAVVGISAQMVAPLEKAMRDFDLRAAIHNHGPNDKLGAFSPIEVLEWIRSADPKIGICMDVGHTFRCGREPSEVAEKCAGRLYDLHMKDLDSSKKSVPVGQGTIDIVRLMKTLLKMNYKHDIALEYEADRDDPAPGIGESIGYQRGVLAAIGA